MALEVIGKLHKKFATVSKGSTAFQTREFVLEIMDGNYQQLIKFQLLKDACALLDKFNEQDEIKVEFNLRGRWWKDDIYLTNLNCWRMDKANGGDAKPVAPTTKQATAPATATQTTHTHHAPLPQTPPPSSRPPLPTASDAPNDGDDDLPF
jgi:single-strand DNA-binding protein